LYELIYTPINTTISLIRFLKYLIEENIFEDVTPLNNLEINIKNPGAVYKQWLST